MYLLSYSRAIDLESRSTEVSEGVYVTDRLTWSVVFGLEASELEVGSQVTFEIRYPSNYDAGAMIIQLQ